MEIDDAPGVNTTVIVPGFSAQNVVAIDALHGFQQESITSVGNGTFLSEEATNQALVTCTTRLHVWPVS